ncbi:hypothetical protein [Nocardioides acrostichi]|uniref:Uncharacterized protein n=1 Tax=Nocardioides acrostichi TaxID=2784339 RepID=A0A930Y7Y3_9ACTN|nr:hypothetical protein [Nocardioides acrostichi]MBF4162532.1 hypothetical protein [Nocardioides acrostichi]
MTAAPTAPTPAKRAGKSAGVIAVQGLNSINTVIQMALFALTLPRTDFDDYAVWVTSGMFMIGLGQAIGTERVVIGRRSFDDGTSTSGVIALAVCAVQVGVSLALGSPALVIASLAFAPYAAYDFQRFTRCYDEAKRFLRVDLSVLVVECVAVLALWATLGRHAWLAVVWWVLGVLPWSRLAGREVLRLRRGVRVLRDDLHQCLPLLMDAALAGVPLVVALALARAQGDVGDASAARMAFTILGPVTVLGLSARRLVYAEVAKGPLSARFTAVWGGICVATLVACALLLSLTRTPLYPWAFPGFVGLSWVAILGFAVNHAAMFSTLLPAASLRAEQRAREVGISRVIATGSAVVVGVLVLPFDSPADVAWCVAAGSIGYTVSLFAARLLTRSSIVPVPEAQPEASA